MNYKVCIVLILSLSAQAHPLKKTITLLDKIQESQAYWETKSQHKKLIFWKQPQRSWKTQIKHHQKILRQQRTKLILILAALSENPQPISSVDVKKLHTQTNHILMKHGAPSHFKRRWGSYAGLVGGLTGLALYLHHLHNSGANPVKNIRTFFKNEKSRSFIII